MPFNEVHFHIGESLRDSQIAEILLRSPSQRDGATSFIKRYWGLPGDAIKLCCRLNPRNFSLYGRSGGEIFRRSDLVI